MVQCRAMWYRSQSVIIKNDLGIINLLCWHPHTISHRDQYGAMIDNVHNEHAEMFMAHEYLNNLVQDWRISSALALEILQYCTKPSISGCFGGKIANVNWVFSHMN